MIRFRRHRSRRIRSLSVVPEMLESRTLLSAGDLDTSFGDGGTLVVPDIRAPRSAFAAVRQSSGKIVIAGSVGANSADRDLMIARYNPDGTPDTSFGNSPDG